MNVVLHNHVIKALKRMPADLRMRVDERLLLFSKNQYHPTLNNHKLIGKYRGERSINVTGDIRAIYYHDKKNNVALFTHLGTHSELYE